MSVKELREQAKIRKLQPFVCLQRSQSRPSSSCSCTSCCVYWRNRGQAEREFKVEVEVIGRVRHKNLVRLLRHEALIIGNPGSEVAAQNALQFGKHGAGVALMGRRKVVVDSAAAPLQFLSVPGFLSDEVHIFGYARTKLTDDELRDRIRGYLSKGKENAEDLAKFLQLIKYVSGAYDAEEGFIALDKAIAEHEASGKSEESAGRRLFYLALPPSVYPPVCKMIKSHCTPKSDQGGWTRIVVEKPFGRDLASAEELSNQIGALFDEPQIYRIDHYLGKELVQNLLVLRFANRFFLPLWNRDHIDNVQIVFREDFGTDGRGGYFDQYGIIRDIIQNHLLQVFCLLAMEKPISIKPEHIRDEKVKVLQSVLPVKDEDVVIGQYHGYTDDPTVPDNSNTPTFATVVLRIHNERWEGVPFIVKAGKALNSRKAEVRIQFKEVPGDIFRCQKKGRNEFVIRLQPSEAMYMKLTVKQPGLEMSTVQSELDLSYGQRYQGTPIPEAYERLILDTIRGDQQHFVRRDELKEAWQIFTPLLHKIDRGELKSVKYEPGSRGPAEADELLQRCGYVQTHGYVWVPPSL